MRSGGKETNISYLSILMFLHETETSFTRKLTILLVDLFFCKEFKKDS